MRASGADQVRDGSDEVQDWVAIAAEAAAELRDVRHGDRGQLLDRLARKHGLAAQTVRRLMAAKRFLDGLTEPEPELARDLRTRSFAAVEAVAKWWRRDPVGAREAAVRFVHERWTVRNLLAAESAAPGSRSLANRMLTSVAKRIAELVVAKVSERRDCSHRIIWAASPYTVALDRKRVEQPFMRRLGEQGLAVRGIAFVLRSERQGRIKDIAVAVVRDDPEHNAFNALAMLAGLTFAGMEGLLVGFEPKRFAWWEELSLIFGRGSEIESLMLDPDVLLVSGQRSQ